MNNPSTYNLLDPNVCDTTPTTLYILPNMGNGVKCLHLRNKCSNHSTFPWMISAIYP